MLKCPGVQLVVASRGVPPHLGIHRGLLAGVNCCTWWPAGGHWLGFTVMPRDQPVVASRGLSPPRPRAHQVLLVVICHHA